MVMRLAAKVRFAWCCRVLFCAFLLAALLWCWCAVLYCSLFFFFCSRAVPALGCAVLRAAVCCCPVLFVWRRVVLVGC